MYPKLKSDLTSLEQLIAARNQIKMCGGLFNNDGPDYWPIHNFSDKCAHLSLKSLQQMSGGLEIGFLVLLLFVVGSSPIGGKIIENKINKK